MSSGSNNSTANCTLSTCPLSEAQVEYDPTLAGNAIYLAIFALFMIPQLVFGIRFQTWGYMIAMICGLVLEVVGYIGRVMLHNNPFNFNNFIIYLVPLTIAPVFFTAAIYICFARLVVLYGISVSRFRPRTYVLFFCISDFIALVLQGAGGGIASTANTSSGSQIGIDIMIAGLGWQVASLSIFALLCAEFAWRVRNSAKRVQYSEVRQNLFFKMFLVALLLATVFIYARSVYRVAELSQGFNGSLANNEVSFMVLEGAMCILATICLTVFHPGLAFQGAWLASNFKLRGKKDLIFEDVPMKELTEESAIL